MKLIQPVFLSIPEFFGHLHPVLVHLPIGILLLAALFVWQSRKDKHENWQTIINIMLFWGMISAVAACITGYILSQGGDYDPRTVGLHQWMGISVAAISVITWYTRKKAMMQNLQWILAALLLLLLFITGHLGGSLTHGSDYLTAPLEDLSGNDTAAVVKRKPIANVQEALVYADLVQPVFQSKCYSCHGASKQKGKLRLDQPDAMLKGGKNGPAIVPGKPDESELIKRILLPREDEHHMAPKEKPQLTGQEVSLLQWWVSSGADFNKKVKDLQQPEKMKSVLASFQNAGEIKSEDALPLAPVEKADEAAIGKLKDAGAVILPVSQTSNYLEAAFITNPPGNATVALLLPLKKQLVRLKLSNAPISDSALAIIGQCSNLIRLQLDHTNITDKGLSHLQSLNALQSLNLVGTQVTAAGVMQLKGLKNLHSLYLYQTRVEDKDWPQLNKAFPKVNIDSGGYKVQFLETDTVIVKPPKIK